MRMHQPAKNSGKKQANLRKCLLPGCENQEPYSRLDHHLKQIHNLTSKDALYRKFIKVPTKIQPVKENALQEGGKHTKFALKITSMQY